MRTIVLNDNTIQLEAESPLDLKFIANAKKQQRLAVKVSSRTQDGPIDIIVFEVLQVIKG